MAKAKGSSVKAQTGSAKAKTASTKRKTASAKATHVAGPSQEARNIMEKYFRPMHGYFDSKFPKACVVSTVVDFNSSFTLQVPHLVDEACLLATKYLTGLWVGDPNQDENIGETRMRVSKLLSDEMLAAADSEHDALMKRDDKVCSTVEAWAKAQLNASITSESFGKWSRVD